MIKPISMIISCVFIAFSFANQTFASGFAPLSFSNIKNLLSGHTPSKGQRTQDFTKFTPTLGAVAGTSVTGGSNSSAAAQLGLVAQGFTVTYNGLPFGRATLSQALSGSNPDFIATVTSLNGIEAGDYVTLTSPNTDTGEFKVIIVPDKDNAGNYAIRLHNVDDNTTLAVGPFSEGSVLTVDQGNSPIVGPITAFDTSKTIAVTVADPTQFHVNDNVTIIDKNTGAMAHFLIAATDSAGKTYSNPLPATFALQALGASGDASSFSTGAYLQEGNITAEVHDNSEEDVYVNFGTTSSVTIPAAQDDFTFLESPSTSGKSFQFLGKTKNPFGGTRDFLYVRAGASFDTLSFTPASTSSGGSGSTPSAISKDTTVLDAALGWNHRIAGGPVPPSNLSSTGTTSDFSNNYEIGFLLGGTLRQIAGPLATDDDDTGTTPTTFRHEILGTDRTTYMGGEATLYFRTGSAEPFITITDFPYAHGMPGFSGWNAFVGITLAAALGSSS